MFQNIAKRHFAPDEVPIWGGEVDGWPTGGIELARNPNRTKIFWILLTDARCYLATKRTGEPLTYEYSSLHLDANGFIFWTMLAHGMEHDIAGVNGYPTGTRR